MDETFHPSTVSEILDRTAQLYRARFLVFLGIAVIPTVALLAPFGGGFLLVTWTGAHSGRALAGVAAVLGITALVLVALPIFIGATALATGAMTYTASRAILNQATTIREAYKAVWPRGWRCIGLWTVDFVAVWVLPLGAWFVLVVVTAALTALAGGAGPFFTVLLFVVVAGLMTYAIWMSIRLSLAFPSAIVEQTGAWNALRRSATLSKGTRWRIFILYLLVQALNTILAIAIIVPAIIGIAMLPGMHGPQHSQALGTVMIFVMYGGRFAIQAFTRPVYGIALMLFYYDQRIRQEAFDIEWMMLQVGLVVPTPVLPGSAMQPVAAVPATAQADAMPVTAGEEPVEPVGKVTIQSSGEIGSEAAHSDPPQTAENPVEPGVAAVPGDPANPAWRESL